MTSQDPDIVVAERLKRLDSIIGKLKREPTMNLWTMQDLGGCRVIVPRLSQVFEIADKFRSSSIRHKYKDENDYILQPRASGYRSYHLVYQYHSDKKETYNRNMLIEIQFRSKLQHLWATAVETMGLFTKQALKAGQGEDDIKRFFVLVSSPFALEEGTAVAPNTSENVDVLVDELKLLNSKNHYIEILRAVRVAVDHVDISKNQKNGYYILILNFTTHRLRLQFFRPSQIEEAMEVYNKIESTRAESKIDAVLVSVSSFGALKIAYPNYFSDIGDFVKKIENYLG